MRKHFCSSNFCVVRGVFLDHFQCVYPRSEDALSWQHMVLIKAHYCDDFRRREVIKLDICLDSINP